MDNAKLIVRVVDINLVLRARCMDLRCSNLRLLHVLPRRCNSDGLTAALLHLEGRFLFDGGVRRCLQRRVLVHRLGLRGPAPALRRGLGRIRHRLFVDRRLLFAWMQSGQPVTVVLASLAVAASPVGVVGQS